MKLLSIDLLLPMPDRNSGHVRLSHMLRLLVNDGHDVTFLAQHIRDGEQPYAGDLSSMGVKVPHAQVGSIDEPGVERVLRDGDFDTVVISFYSVARIFLPLVRRVLPHARVIIDTIDLHFVRERRAGLSQAEQTYRDEIDIYSQADELIAITDVERATLLAELPEAKITVVPNIHEVGIVPADYERRSGLLFVGNFWHQPNTEGVVWFCNEVLPRVRERLPEVMLHVVGQNPPQAITTQQSPRIRVEGWVPATLPFLQACRLSIAPLLSGAGMKGKVGEALAAGLPVVTTSIGAEGMGLTHKQDVMIADSPEAFADAVIEAYLSRELWTRLSSGGQRLINARYTPAAARAALREIFEPAEGAKLHFFAAPDWTDRDVLTRIVGSYITRYRDAGRGPSLELAVLDRTITESFAFDTLVGIITSLGHDPESIPDILITSMSADDVALLPPDTIHFDAEDTLVES